MNQLLADAKMVKYEIPFIYKIGESYYCIGRCVFRPCTAAEQELFENYEKNIIAIHAKMKCESYSPDCEDTQELVKYFAKICTVCDVEYSCEKERIAKCELEKFLEELNDYELQSIIYQRENINEALSYSDSAFYRYSKENRIDNKKLMCQLFPEQGN